MGIKGLSKLIGDHAPNSIKRYPLKHLFGRRVAVDASLCIYQFLTAIRTEGQVLTNELGMETSHLSGLFYRAIRMCSLGIKPIFVFDGKPPEAKDYELAKRQKRREDAQNAVDNAENDAQRLRLGSRTVKMTKVHIDECKTLLCLMGIPCIDAPGEAEAQCAVMAKAGLVWGVASEDMDTLAFGCPRLLRHVTASEAQKIDVAEFDLEVILDTIGITMESFIDLCIMLGCDYSNTIRGIGPKRAIDLIKNHGTLEAVLVALKKSDCKIKNEVPDDFAFEVARNEFKNPNVTIDSELCNIDVIAKPVDEEGLIKFMVTERGFAEERIRNGLAKLTVAKKKGTQARIDSFFTVKKTKTD